MCIDESCDGEAVRFFSCKVCWERFGLCAAHQSRRRFYKMEHQVRCIMDFVMTMREMGFTWDWSNQSAFSLCSINVYQDKNSLSEFIRVYTTLSELIGEQVSVCLSIFSIARIKFSQSINYSFVELYMDTSVNIGQL